MKQIIQDLKGGNTILEEVPAPEVKPRQILIKTHRSLVSLGTERMLVEFGKSSLISKARQQPDKVKMVLDKVKAEGLIPTMEAIFKKLGEPLPLGYCNAGEVIGVGKGVSEFKIGDRVASNGQHAEFVSVPKNLVCHIPDNVSYDEAAFTVIGSIGLQGIRLINPTLGETVVVIGLGLIGLITAELLLANGCNVIGFDFDEEKIKLAQEKGVKAYNSSKVDPVKTAEELTSGVGVDAVIITASTSSSEVISQSAQMCRQRGKVVLVGVIGLNISRADFFAKEIEFQVSCSYGPGRYDDDYELKGQDYPIGFVRWTENRNFQTILSAISKGQIDVKRLITEVVDLDKYQQIYGDMKGSNSIASILKYDENSTLSHSVTVDNAKTFVGGKDTLAIIGAGNFTKMTMMPILKDLGANMKYIVSSGGVSGTHLSKKYGVAVSSTSYDDVLQDKEVDAVIITTRHNLHANMVTKALEAGKHVFVEKPMVLTSEELDTVLAAYEKSGKSVTVGFNRRFAPFIQKVKKEVGNSPEPMSVVMNVNAGFIPTNVWVHDMEVGGGRIIGEGCHFIDLITHLTGSEVESVCANALGTNPAENSDNVSIMLKYKNGSQGVVNYWANGHKAYSKERFEVFYQGKVMIIDNFRKLTGYGTKSFNKSSGRLDKGHSDQFKSYIAFLKKGGEPIIPFHQIVNSTKASIAAIESLKTGSWKQV